jgi:general secretion pathway protein C
MAQTRRYHSAMVFPAAKTGSPLLAKLIQHSLNFHERHGRQLPAVVAAVFVLLIGWTLADLIWALVPLPEAAHWRPAPVTAQSTAPARRGPDVAAIAAARLFGDYRRSMSAARRTRT